MYLVSLKISRYVLAVNKNVKGSRLRCSGKTGRCVIARNLRESPVRFRHQLRMRMTFGELIYSSYRASLSGTCQHLDTTFNLYLRKMLTLSIPTDGTDSGYYTAGRSFKSGSGAPKKLHIFNSTLSCTLPHRSRNINAI